MYKFNKRNCVLTLLAFGQGVLCVSSTQARLVYSTEEEGVHTPAFYLNQDDTSDDFVDLNFGTSSGAQVRYDVINDDFTFNRNVNFDGNEITNFEIERLAVAPTCDGTAIGRMYFNTASSQTFVCDGTTFNVLENTGFLTTVDISDDTNLAAGTGITLTDDTLSVDLGTDIGIAEIANGGNNQVLTTTGAGVPQWENKTNFATAAQGTLADSALQSGDNISELVNDAGFITTDTDTTYTGSDGITLTGTNFTNNFSTAIETGEITDGTITFADLNSTDITLADFTNDLALTSAQIFVGNGSGVATGVAASGDVTLDNTGAFTIADNAVDGTDIALGSDTAGDIMFYNGTDWDRLAVGTAGQVLQVNGTADAPVWNTGTAVKYQFVDIFGCVRGSASAGTVGGGNSAVVRFDSGGNSQMRCALPVPSDWQAGTDINIEVYYSPSDNTAGDVQFQLRHAAFGIGETVASSSFVDTVTGVEGITASTQLDIYELSEDIPAAGLAVDDMINFNLRRTPGVAADTYAGSINIHQLRISYTGKEL